MTTGQSHTVTDSKTLSGRARAIHILNDTNKVYHLDRR